MDEVRHFLQGLGHRPQPCRFLDTGFMLGERIDTPDFSLTYRQEGTRLVMCDWHARQPNGRALQALMTLLHQIRAAVPALVAVDALILAAEHDPALQHSRQRLVRYLLAQGARPVEIDGQRWLRLRNG